MEWKGKCWHKGDEGPRKDDRISGLKVLLEYEREWAGKTGSGGHRMFETEIVLLVMGNDKVYTYGQGVNGWDRI